jgi:malonate-semialdehyde dehydrogenase (acetylating)/methylmalonate-semialdehyde dehydrogenase
MPDADKEATLNALVSSAFGAAGQRCMALSAAVFVGEAKQWIPELEARAASMKCGIGSDATSDLGPVISVDALKRAERIVGTAETEGAKILLDGRGVKVRCATLACDFISCCCVVVSLLFRSLLLRRRERRFCLTDACQGT